MELVNNKHSFSISNHEGVISEHKQEKAFVYIGKAKENIEQTYGDFDISEKIIEKIPLRQLEINENTYTFKNGDYRLECQIDFKDDEITISHIKMDKEFNRIYFKIASNENEHLYGCGEQFSYLNLKGREFPIWTSEPGVGRDREKLLTYQADLMGVGGGDYYTTNFPQATFISDSMYMLHMDTSLYSVFDFSEKNVTEICVWGTPEKLSIYSRNSFVEIMNLVTEKFGTQPKLPSWLLDGVTLGMQGGTEVVYEKVRQALDCGINVNAVWCQDWVGKKITSFGKRLFWKWEKSDETYPNLEKLIADLKEQNIRFLAYINSYLVEGTDMFDYAKEKGYFVKKNDGQAYIADFGEFHCGTIDFTNPEANTWYKEIIKTNMIDLGISGWMADFGEYIPVDAVFANGKTGKEMHNIYPALWAKCNYEAVQERNKLGEVVYFMRAGGVGSAKYNTLFWAGDQSVDFTLHDGIASTIPAGISLGLMGNGLTHFDIGGYTSLFGNVRTEEMLLRSLEYAVFTPYMRTHEGNRPDENFQYSDTEKSLQQFAKATELRHKLLPYIEKVIEENANTGMGAMRPLFLHYDDEACLDIAYEYLFGRDLLVAPVYEEGRTDWEVYLPEDTWVHLFTKEVYQGGRYTVSAEIGDIPVFYRQNSEFSNLFATI